MQTAVKTTLTEPLRLRKRIGSTVYLTNLYFINSAAETMTDKILRLVKNDLHFASENAIISLPQTGRLPERSSV